MKENRDGTVIYEDRVPGGAVRSGADNARARAPAMQARPACAAAPGNGRRYCFAKRGEKADHVAVQSAVADATTSR
jgi:hypothetical protein